MDEPFTQSDHDRAVEDGIVLLVAAIILIVAAFAALVL